MKKFLPIFAFLGLVSPVAHSWAAGGSAVRIQIVDERGMPVRDAVVTISPASGTAGGFKFPWRAAMAQKDLAFAPGTLVVAKGSSVAFPNLDRVRHSIYSFSKPARFEIDLYGRDQSRSQGFPIVGTVSLGCKIHDSMRGYIRVVDTPYAGKTDNNGLISLAGVPTGRATVTLWHPHLRAPGNETSSAVMIADGLSKKYAVKLK